MWSRPPLSCSLFSLYLGTSCRIYMYMNERVGNKLNRHIILQYQVIVPYQSFHLYTDRATRWGPRALYPSLFHLKWLTASYMMTSSNGNSFRVTVPLCGEFTGHRWIPLKASNAENVSMWWCLRDKLINSRRTMRWVTTSHVNLRK